jgi:nicotinamide riboside transporter PnuC
MTWLFTAISLLGNYLNCRKLRCGFLVWIVCNICWLAYDIMNGIYSRAVLDIVQTGFSIYGYIEWGKIDEREEFKRRLP